MSAEPAAASGTVHAAGTAARSELWLRQLTGHRVEFTLRVNR
ncbi:hypothetical protein AB0K68_06545 [Streptomyces sp. NPDC050698]